MYSLQVLLDKLIIAFGANVMQQKMEQYTSHAVEKENNRTNKSHIHNYSWKNYVLA